MADNTTLNLGTGGDVIATDDIGGVKHQLVKLEFGAADSATQVSAAAPLPVVLTGTNNVTNAGTFAVQAAATLAAETTKVIGTVNIAAAQTVATVTAVTAITNALPVGANVIGALTANQSVNVAQINGVAATMGNGASGTGVQRVTLANDSTGVLATVTNVATIGTSVTPGTAATNLGKAEDAPHTSGDVGVFALGIRQDADTSPVSASGDYHGNIYDANGYLKVNIKAGAGSGGTALADAAAFTRGSTSVTPFAGVVETSAPTVTNGNTTVASFTTGGALRVDVSSGGIQGVAEDAAAAGGETGILVVAVRRDTPSSDVSAAGDFASLQVDSLGSQWVRNSNEIADDAAFTVGTSRVAPIGLMADETSTDSVDEGDVGVPRMTLDRKQIVTPASHTAGGATPTSVVSAASTNATSHKASAGQVYSVTASNVNAAMRYLKFYNKASAPTVGTDTPVYVLPLPGNTAGAGITHSFPTGLEFTTGIAWALTTGAALADTGAVSAAEHIVSIASK